MPETGIEGLRWWKSLLMINALLELFLTVCKFAVNLNSSFYVWGKLIPKYEIFTSNPLRFVICRVNKED